MAVNILTQIPLPSKVRRLSQQPYFSMKFALNNRELEGVSWALGEYARRYGERGEDNPDLFIHLGDNPSQFLCWSASSNKIPTYRTGAGKYWNPYREQWLLPRDKLSSLGLPVTEDMSKCMSVPGLPMVDTARASSVVGNSFHFCTAAIVQLVALSCFKFRQVIDSSAEDDNSMQESPGA